jgi:putative PIN family toxin of toxin-antitoxin system
MSERRRVVFDCNTLLQALGSPKGPAGECVQLALSGEVDLFLSPVVIAELRDVASRPKVVRKLSLTPERLGEFVEAIELAATLVEGFSEPFVYSRDPDDAHYVNLALAVDAKLIVTRDADLLDLMDSSREEGRDFLARFPALRILVPPAFLNEVRKGRD